MPLETGVGITIYATASVPVYVNWTLRSDRGTGLHDRPDHRTG